MDFGVIVLYLFVCVFLLYVTMSIINFINLVLFFVLF